MGQPASYRATQHKTIPGSWEIKVNVTFGYSHVASDHLNFTRGVAVGSQLSYLLVITQYLYGSVTDQTYPDLSFSLEMT
jgi:hypothetical protein